MQKKSLSTILYSAGGVIAMAAILIAFNVLTGTFPARMDLTQEKAYTLSAGTRAILAKLDTPVKIRYYCTQTRNATAETVFLQKYARTVEDLLTEYKQAANGKIILEKYDPQPDSDAEDSARLDGVEGVPLSSGEKYYLGLAVSLLDAKEAIPFLAPNEERLLEYRLSRAITRVVTPEKPVIGVMTALPVFGMPANPMMMQMGQRGQEPWALISELKNDFNVKRVELTAEEIDKDIRVLLVLHPKDISDKTQFAIDQFVLRGGRLIAFLDAQSVVDQPRGQNQMFGQMGGGSSLDKLLKAWGIEYDKSKVVADMNFKMQLGGGGGAQPQEAPAWLALTPEGINPDDIITGQIDSIWLPCAGAFTGKPVDGLKLTPLLRSTKASQLVDGFLANLSGESILKDFKSSDTEYSLAIRLTGRFKTAFPDGDPRDTADTNAPPAATAALKESAAENAVILVGDADMLYDNFTIRSMNSPFGPLSMAMNANLNFAQNAVEQMTGDSNLITVRSRAVQNRPFEVVKRMEAEARARFQGEIASLQKKADEAQQRLGELQAQKSDKNQKYILSPEQQREIENLEKESAETNRKLRTEQKKLRQEVDSLQTRLTWLNILTVPVLVCLGGIALAFYKRKLTAAR